MDFIQILQTDVMCIRDIWFEIMNGQNPLTLQRVAYRQKVVSVKYFETELKMSMKFQTFNKFSLKS